MGGMGGGGSCPVSSATGTLSIRFSGLPLIDGLVTLPPAVTEITTDSVVTLPAGPQDVWAYNVAANETPFRDAYEPTAPITTACVLAGQQTIVDVSYRVVQTSGMLWLGAGNNPTSSTLFGYAPSRGRRHRVGARDRARQHARIGRLHVRPVGQPVGHRRHDRRRTDRALPRVGSSRPAARRHRTSSSTASPRRFPEPEGAGVRHPREPLGVGRR